MLIILNPSPTSKRPTVTAATLSRYRVAAKPRHLSDQVPKLDRVRSCVVKPLQLLVTPAGGSVQITSFRCNLAQSVLFLIAGIGSAPMRRYNRPALMAVMLGGLALWSTPLPAADVAISRAYPPPVAVQEGTCLRWVWQEYSWYDDCAWQRHPYVGRSVQVLRSPRR
jgi:hypothetical protein